MHIFKSLERCPRCEKRSMYKLKITKKLKVLPKQVK